MKNIIIMIVITAVILNAEWSDNQVQSQLEYSKQIKNRIELQNTELELSLYNPMLYTPSILNPEEPGEDEINIEYGKGSIWFESWNVTQNNANRYTALDGDNHGLGYYMGTNVFGVQGLSSGNEFGYWIDYPSNVVFTNGIKVDQPNAVGMQLSDMDITPSKKTDTKINEKTDDASALVGNFRDTVQTYLNYQWDGKPLFEIDLEPIGLFWERIKERLPGYVVPDAPVNVFQNKKISCSLVPVPNTFLYTIHQQVTNYRDLITYCMWGFLVFEIFNMIVAYANK